METAGIYGLANLLGHRAVSISVILANRITGKFSENPDKLVDDLIVYCLTKLTTQS
jgi:uridine phosphorylase